MSFNDIFKSSFLENVSEFSILDTVIGLAVALVIGLFIFIIYKKTLTGVLYSSGFALTLVGLSLVTTLVIMAVTSNVVLSLGMVGALSIVRFRTAIKEPVEIVFLFWSLAVGIVIGAGMIKESLSKEESNGNDSFSFKTMLLLALATSIDALAVGITFALLPDVNVPLAVCLIGITTFVCSAAGLKVGNLFGLKYKAKAELAGGIILILIGLKILLEHLGVISF